MGRLHAGRAGARGGTEGEAAPAARLIEAKVIEFGVVAGTIRFVVKRETWKHVA